ncbi:hypothetical protein C8Q77DRAFT_772034 [Trametes polyzona]|nr:hypothetical protein C8Q77DRAFT_772034 [Trametes polyzona]
MHTLEVVNAGPAAVAGDNAGSLLVLAAVNVTTVEEAAATPAGAATSPGLSKGAIAALAIGLTLAVALAAVAAVCFVRRRRRIARRKREMLVNPRINRAGRLSFLFPYKRFSHASASSKEKEKEREKEAKKTEADLERGGEPERVLDISSPNPSAQEEKHDDSEEDDDDSGEGVGEVTSSSASSVPRFTAAEKGKAPATVATGTTATTGTRRSNASKNSDGSYSIDLPDLTIAQVPRGYLPTSMVPSTPSPPRTFPGSLPSPTSPRSTRPRGPREMQGRDSTRGILLTNMGPASPTGDDDGERLGPPSWLPEPHTSPLRVEFATELPERPERRTERAVSTGTAVSLPQSLQQAIAQQRNSVGPGVTSPGRSEPVYSFLDFNNSSTSTGLTRSRRQSASNSTGKSSKRNTGTGSEHSTQEQSVNWASLPPDRRISLGLSMTVSGGPTASRPSLSPSVLLQPVPLPPAVPPLPLPTISTDQQTLSSSSSEEPEGPDQPFPYEAAGGLLPSPTDSIPFTVSDIHFRHSTQSSFSGHPNAESRRASAQRLSGSHRVPHPPLPGAASPTPGPSSPTLLPGTRGHHRHGSAAGGAGGSQTVPPFIVQRILGRAAPGSNPGSPFASPTAQQFASISGSMSGVGRAGATPARGGAPSPVPPSPPAAPSAAGGRGSGGAQGSGSGSGSGVGSGAGSGSGPTVFGFQLGRHR